MFGRLGLTPERQMAKLAGVSELTGGVLTATGVADPLGPIAVASTMAVATAVHRKGGPFATKGGYELPLTNLAFAVVLATARPGHRVGPHARPAADRGGGRGRSGPGRDGAVQAARSGPTRGGGAEQATMTSSPARPRPVIGEDGRKRISRRARGSGSSRAKFALESSWIP